MAETIPDYDELELRLQRGGEGSYRVWATGPDDSRGSEDFALPFSEEERKIFVLTVGAARSGVRGFRTPQMETAKRFGSDLCDALLTGSVRDIYTSARRIADENNRGLRVTLHLGDVPELMGIPWEFLYEQRAFLSQSIYTPVVRALDLASPRPPGRVVLPLRVLGVVSSPQGFAQLDVDAEKAKLEGALAPLRDHGRLELEWVEAATLAEVERTVGTPADYHIFHYIGHGAYDHRTQEGVLVFENDHGGPREASGEELCALLGDERSLRLAVLNACEGARTSDIDPFSGVASSLIGCRIPAVVGMQFEITDAAAVTFAERLYTALVQGYPVDAAIALARKAIFAAGNDVEFGTPVLFLQGAETRLFDIVEEGSGDEATRPPHVPVVTEADFAVHLEPRSGEPERGRSWQLTVRNTGACPLSNVVAHDEDGQPLAPPADLEVGRYRVIRWDSREGASERRLVTVSASDPWGSRLSEQVIAVDRDEPRAVEPSATEGGESNVQRFLERAGEFEYGLYSAQRAELVGRIDVSVPNEVLLGMCRCALAGETFRSVAVLLTSTRLIWARQTLRSKATVGIVAWGDVRSVRHRDPNGLELELGDGSTFALTQFNGRGVCINDPALAFTSAALHDRVSELVGQAPAPAHPELPENPIPGESLEPPEEQVASATRNIALFDRGAVAFENKLYKNQREELRTRIEGDEVLLGMCRCAMAAETFRSVAALLTSKRLIWARETLRSTATADVIPWRDVRSVSTNLWGHLKLELADGSTFALAQFTGRGVHLDDPSLEFDAKSLRDRINELITQPAVPPDT